MRHAKSLGRSYFDNLYARDPDPWRFASSPYEAAKYAQTLAVAGAEPSRFALEVGCSIGVLTRQLAALCERLVATEIATAALAEARRRCADLVNVEFRLATGAADALHGAFDLIVLSEVVYYWDDADLAAVGDAVTHALEPGGRLLLVHWLGETDYPKSADDAVAALASRLPRLVVDQQIRTDLYRLDVWRGRP